MTGIPARRADQERWNEKYSAAGFAPSFAPHPLAVEALGLPLPDGPLLELAAGPSGSALYAAARGRPVIVVDISEVALGLLAAEAEARQVGELITEVQADLNRWRPTAGGCALVLATSYWEYAVFGPAAAAVAPGGVLAWESLTLAAHRKRPSIPEQWCVRAGEPASLLPEDFVVLRQDTIGHAGTRRQLIARRR